MWATRNSIPSASNDRRGFTIVELLIVIVVIGILAAITIVAYNGIQQKAREVTLKSDLAGAASLMAAEDAQNGSYPLAEASVNNNKGLPASSGTSYQYQSTGASYCITGTSGSISYAIQNTSTSPMPGACPGDNANGAITNLAANPSFESGVTGWAGVYGQTPIARVTGGSGVILGTAALEANIGTANQAGVQYTTSGLLASTNYIVSAYVTLISGDPTNLSLRVGDGSGTQGSKSFASLLIVNQPVRVFLPWKSSPTSPNASVFFWRSGVSTGSAVIRLDGVLITTGSVLYGYADGSSPDWTWDGAVNQSTSRGMPK